jgi:multiple sugar transport system substrate-binding protein
MTTDIVFFAPDTDPFVDAVVRHLPEFEQTTGHTVRPRIVPSDRFFANEIRQDLKAGEGADVFMSGPVLMWEHLPDGIVQPLDDFVARPDDAWDMTDFLESTLASNRWTGRFGDPIGAGPLLGIPVNCESYNLAYHRPELERLGLAVPTTWSAYFAAAEAIAQDGRLRGFAQRGLAAWHTMYTGFATQLWAYGGSDFDADGHADVASAASVAATTDFVRHLQTSGPEAWTDQRWYELAMDFAAGRYGLIVDSDHYAPYYESGTSAMAGRIGYALTPIGPIGRPVSNMWTWSLVMNARSRRKDVAWQFMQWASSSAFLERAAREGNFNPTRRSVWESDGFAEMTSTWGAYSDVSRQLAESIARVLVTPAVNYRGVAEHWVEALRSAYLGRDVEEALRDAARRMDTAVDRSFGGI